MQGRIVWEFYRRILDRTPVYMWIKLAQYSHFPHLLYTHTLYIPIPWALCSQSPLHMAFIIKRVFSCSNYQSVDVCLLQCYYFTQNPHSQLIDFHKDLFYSFVFHVPGSGPGSCLEFSCWIPSVLIWKFFRFFLSCNYHFWTRKTRYFVECFRMLLKLVLLLARYKFDICVYTSCIGICIHSTMWKCAHTYV